MPRLVRLALLMSVFLYSTSSHAAALAPIQAARPLAVTPTNRMDEPRWRQLFSTTLKEASAQPNANVIFLGDSITQGWRKHPDLWNAAFGHHRPLNAGIWGDGTQHLLWRIEHGQLRSLSPKLVVIMIGTNNGLNTAAEIVAGVEANVTEVRYQLPKTKILILGILPSGADPRGKRRMRNQTVNQALQALADGDRVHYLDLGGHFVTKDGTIPPELSPDQLHLSRKGYEIWARELAPTVDRLCALPASGTDRK